MTEVIRMKRIRWLLFTACVFAMPFLARAQSTANLTASDAGACSTANACLQTGITPTNGGAVFTLAGTFSGTVQFEALGAPTGAWAALNVTPTNSTTAVTSATAGGTWQANIAGYIAVRIRCSTYGSGTIVATINVSNQSARTNGAGGGGGSGTVSGQANGVVPLATAPATIGAQSHISDNGTNIGLGEAVTGLDDKGSQIFNVVAYGADPTNTSDSLAGVEAAMTAACASTPARGAVVFFPAGKYQFSNIIPTTSTLWCNGLTIKGSGVRATELDFPTGTGFAITEAGGTGLGNDIRNLTIEDFLLVVGGGSGGSNNGLGGIFIGNYAFTHEYRNLYIIGPTTSTASGISTNGDAYVSTIGLDNVRVDNFQGSGGYGFQFTVSGTGDLLRCTFCYANSNNIGIYVSFFWTAILESSDVDGSNNIGFYLQPGNGNTIIGNGLSGEGNTHDLYRIYGNAGATTGGTVILTNPKSSGQLSATSAFYPIDITNFAGDVTIVNPVTVSTGGSATASLNISNTPHAVTIIGCDQLLDKGFSSSANTYLGQGQGNVCSNTQGSFSVTALSQPGTPTVTPTCTGTCTSTWGYEVVAFDSNLNATQASAAGSTAAQASTLTTSNLNTITWLPVPGARYYNVYRTTSGGTPANLSLVCTNYNASTLLSCVDNGTVNTGSVTPSSVNGTGILKASALGLGASPPSCPTGTAIWCAAEAATAGTPATGIDYMRANSTTHSWECSLNNGAESACNPLIPNSDTSGDLVSWGTWPNQADSGVLAANVNSNASNFTSGDLVSANGNHTTADSGVIAANAVLAVSPGAGIAHFAGSTQTVTSSTIATGDIAAGAVTGAKIANNAVSSTQMAVVNTRRTCSIVIGSDDASAALVNADLGPQLNQCQVDGAATIFEIDVMADNGTPNVIVQRSHLGTATALLSGALATAASGAVACSNTGGTTGLDGTTTCTNTLQNTSIAVGDWIGLTSGTAGGTAKRMSIMVHFTVN